MGFFSNLTGGGKGMPFSDSLKYLSDYKTELVTDEKGREKKRARYIGPWYFITSEPEPSRVKMIVSLVLGILAAVCHVFILLNNSFTVCELPIMVPILLALFPLLYLIMGVSSLPFSLKPMHRDRHAHSFMRASKSSVAVAAMLFIGLAAFVIYRLVQKDFAIFPGNIWLFMGLIVGEIVLALAVIRLLYTVEREERPNSAYDEGLIK